MRRIERKQNKMVKFSSILVFAILFLILHGRIIGLVKIRNVFDEIYYSEDELYWANITNAKFSDELYTCLTAEEMFTPLGYEYSNIYFSESICVNSKTHSFLSVNDDNCNIAILWDIKETDLSISLITNYNQGNPENNENITICHNVVYDLIKRQLIYQQPDVHLNYSFFDYYESRRENAAPYEKPYFLISNYKLTDDVFLNNLLLDYLFSFSNKVHEINYNESISLENEDDMSLFRRAKIDKTETINTMKKFLFDVILTDWFSMNGNKSRFSMDNLGEFTEVWEEW